MKFTFFLDVWNWFDALTDSWLRSEAWADIATAKFGKAALQPLIERSELIDQDSFYIFLL